MLDAVGAEGDRADDRECRGAETHEADAETTDRAGGDTEQTDNAAEPGTDRAGDHRRLHAEECELGRGRRRVEVDVHVDLAVPGEHGHPCGDTRRRGLVELDLDLGVTLRGELGEPGLGGGGVGIGLDLGPAGSGGGGDLCLGGGRVRLDLDGDRLVGERGLELRVEPIEVGDDVDGHLGVELRELGLQPGRKPAEVGQNVDRVLGVGHGLERCA